MADFRFAVASKRPIISQD